MRSPIVNFNKIGFFIMTSKELMWNAINELEFYSYKDIAALIPNEKIDGDRVSNHLSVVSKTTELNWPEIAAPAPTIGREKQIQGIHFLNAINMGAFDKLLKDKQALVAVNVNRPKRNF